MQQVVKVQHPQPKTAKVAVRQSYILRIVSIAQNSPARKLMILAYWYICQFTVQAEYEQPLRTAAVCLLLWRNTSGDSQARSIYTVWWCYGDIPAALTWDRRSKYFAARINNFPASPANAFWVNI